MKKIKIATKTTKRTSPKSVSKNLVKRRSFFQDVFRFRWLKKAMVGKTQNESLDLLDQWILKKKSLTLFF